MTEYAIEADGLGKRYLLGEDAPRVSELQNLPHLDLPCCDTLF